MLTFFPFVDAGPGRAGPGAACAVAYSVAPGALDAWIDRLADAAVDFDGPEERFGERMIAVRDPHGLLVELIENAAAPEPTHAFHSVTLWVDRPEPTARVLEDLFGYESAASDTADVDGVRVERQRFVSPQGGPGSIVDIVRRDERVRERQGAGSVHHVAFRAESDEVQLEWRERVAAAGLHVTPVIDRQYFNAIYFREPGGILFEIATDPPGFAIDEPLEELGTHLLLPEQHEPRRARIEQILPPIRVRDADPAP